MQGVYRVWAGALNTGNIDDEVVLNVRVIPFESDAEPGRAEGLPNYPHVGTGTGFFVSDDGHVMTNEHVVDGCSVLGFRVLGGPERPLRLVAKDALLDLAILKSDFVPDAVASFAARPAKVGDGVVVFGFPFTGELSSKGNLQVGLVSAPTGPKDDPSRFQISAGIQPGNSGGPILDESGAVIGVAVATSADAATLAKSKVVLKNVNFAIHGEIAQKYLTDNGMVHSSGDRPDRDLEDVLKEARRFTGLITCYP